MSLQDIVVYLLLGAGVACVVLACLGLALMSNVFERLHYVAPASLGAVLIAGAIWVREGPSGIALKATLVAGLILVVSPALAHGTARAARLSEFGDWRPRPDEGIEVEEP
jgi:multisubunit Na+/H+ antiporter MnhG subunit